MGLQVYAWLGSLDGAFLENHSRQLQAISPRRSPSSVDSIQEARQSDPRSFAHFCSFPTFNIGVSGLVSFGVMGGIFFPGFKLSGKHKNRVYVNSGGILSGCLWYFCCLVHCCHSECCCRNGTQGESLTSRPR
jgi:hypothetical protein